MNSKPKYLCAFGYHRQNWIAPLIALEEDVQLVFVFHIYKADEQIEGLNAKIVYWSDFSSAQDLLDQIKPQKVIFMSIDSPLTIALNSVARKMQIRTVFLQHGLMHSLKMYDEVQRRGTPLQVKTQEPSKNALARRNFILKFFLSSLRFYNLKLLIYQFRLSLLERKHSKAIAKSKVYSDLVLADKYIVYTRENAKVLSERDKVSDEKLIPVGIPEFDIFFETQSDTETYIEPYMLLIDYPMAEVKEYNNTGAGYTKKEVNNMYLALSDYAKAKGCSLKIKLHPYSYESEFMVQDKNITYLRHADTKDLILKSKLIFGAVSSLMLPALVFKAVVLIEVFENSDFALRLQELGMCDSFTVKEIINGALISAKPKMNSRNKDLFVNEYLYKTDGQSMKRVISELLRD